jgi:CRISPR-associated protein Cas1
VSATPDLIPVRALNQATYCPRLYYLQYVDCVMPTNEHVEGGLFDHRRVDDPDLKLKTRTEGEAVRTRGVPVSSETLGVSGVLDQIEEKHGERYPVETKHGTAPRDADGKPTTWDNDAVQLCAQAMLLEEQSGQGVARGFQFYAGSRERVAVEFTPELRRKTLDTISLCQQLSASDSPPSPLPAELRHRCFGCSLAPVCLPEETLFQLTAPEKAEEASSPALVRVIPGNDDGAVLYVNEPGSYVGKRSEHLVVKKDGQETTKVPMHAVRQVVLFGNVQVSTQALQTLIENEIPVSLLTGHGKFIGGFQPPPKKNVHLREAQFKLFADPAACLGLGWPRRWCGRSWPTSGRCSCGACGGRATAAARSGPPATWPTCSSDWTGRTASTPCSAWRGRGRPCTSASSGGSSSPTRPAAGSTSPPATAARRATRSTPSCPSPTPSSPRTASPPPAPSGSTRTKGSST